MQRLHVNDLTGFIGSSGDFKKLALPAIATKSEQSQSAIPRRIYVKKARHCIQNEKILKRLKPFEIKSGRKPLQHSISKTLSAPMARCSN